MAIKLTNKPNTVPVSSTFPYGDIRDNSGINNGTPVNREVYGDFHQFFEKLMHESGLVHNNLPDNYTNGFQLFEALMALNGGLMTKVYEIGPWDMNAENEKTINIPAYIMLNLRGISVTVRDNLGGIVDYINLLHPPDLSRKSGLGIMDPTGILGLRHHPTECVFSALSIFSGTSGNRGWISISHA